MKTKFWLIANSSGSIRTVKNTPDLKWNEVAIQVELDLPADLFKRPTLSAAIKIDQDKVPAIHIDTEVVHGVEEVLKQQGINVKLKVKELPEE